VKELSLLEDADLPVGDRVPWLPERLGKVPHTLLFLWAKHHPRVVKVEHFFACQDMPGMEARSVRCTNEEQRQRGTLRRRGVFGLDAMFG
jgi:hypothetical protein